MNTITITGNLVADPQLRYTNDGRPVANFAVAVNRRARDQASGNWTDQLDGYFECSTWDNQANAIASLKKGDRIIVTGRQVARKWQDNDGNTRTSWSIDVNEAGPSFRFGLKNERNSAVAALSGQPDPFTPTSGQEAF